MEKMVTLDKIIASEHLQIIYMPDSAGEKGAKRTVCSTDVNRPGLPLSGFFDHFDESRIQILGNVEMGFLMEKSSEERAVVFDGLFSRNIPAIVITRNLPVPEELVENAKRHEIPVLASTQFRIFSRFSGFILHFRSVYGKIVTVYRHAECACKERNFSL